MRPAFKLAVRCEFHRTNKDMYLIDGVECTCLNLFCLLITEYSREVCLREDRIESIYTIRTAGSAGSIGENDTKKKEDV